jgi:glycosyltransferase involved in cell wall biosynthesis
LSLVTVITPAYRAEPFLARAVLSVLAQGWQDWEMIVVADDGADYQELLARAGVADPRLRFLPAERARSGPGATRNRALALARGEYLAPLDADDRFEPGRLAQLVPLAAAHGMAGDNVRVVEDASGAVRGSLFPEGPGLRWLGFRECAEAPVPMAFVLRRDLVTWRWEEELGLAEDTLFNLRALEVLGRVPVAGAALHEYRVREGSLCHAADSAERAEQSYTRALERLAEEGLGFHTPEAVGLVREMLLARRQLNRAFRASYQAGECRDFQEFVAARSRSPAGA